MHCVVWTYAVPPDLDEERIRALYDQVAERYLGISGLVRKYFALSEDASEVVGIYLWQSKDDAERFYTPEWIADVTERWGAEPRRDDWIVPIVAETQRGEVVREDAHPSSNAR